MNKIVANSKEDKELEKKVKNKLKGYEGLTKEDKKILFREYLNSQSWSIIFYVLFIILSSAYPVISWNNGALYVLSWYLISLCVGDLVYISQKNIRKKAEHYESELSDPKDKNEKETLETIINEFPAERGGWTLLEMQIFVGLFIACILLFICTPMQLIDNVQYSMHFSSFFLGILIDTLLVTIMTAAVYCEIDDVKTIFLYDKRHKSSATGGIKSKRFSIKCTIPLIVMFACFIGWVVCSAIFEFNGVVYQLLGEKGQMLLGVAYIIFMVTPIIRELIKKDC